MPTYEYRLPSGQVVERVLTIAQMQEEEQKDESGKKFLMIDGEKAVRLYGAKTTLPGNWPLESEACGVNPSQVHEAMAADRANGVPTRYNHRTGNPIFESPGHRRAWLKSQRMHDNDSYI